MSSDLISSLQTTISCVTCSLNDYPGTEIKSESCYFWCSAVKGLRIHPIDGLFCENTANKIVELLTTYGLEAYLVSSKYHFPSEWFNEPTYYVNVITVNPDDPSVAQSIQRYLSLVTNPGAVRLTSTEPEVVTTPDSLRRMHRFVCMFQ